MELTIHLILNTLVYSNTFNKQPIKRNRLGFTELRLSHTKLYRKISALSLDLYLLYIQPIICINLLEMTLNYLDKHTQYLSKGEMSCNIFTLILLLQPKKVSHIINLQFPFYGCNVNYSRCYGFLLAFTQ